MTLHQEWWIIKFLFGITMVYDLLNFNHSPHILNYCQVCRLLADYINMTQLGAVGIRSRRVFTSTAQRHTARAGTAPGLSGKGRVASPRVPASSRNKERTLASDTFLCSQNLAEGQARGKDSINVHWTDLEVQDIGRICLHLTRASCLQRAWFSLHRDPVRKIPGSQW